MMGKWQPLQNPYIGDKEIYISLLNIANKP